jgi:hypothetical protein
MHRHMVRTGPARRELIVLSGVAAVVVGAHLAVVHQYGIFRDELYYLACGRHLAWGYVDHPPVVAVLARISSWFGNSLLAIRIISILLSGVLVFIVGAIVRRLGGGAFAQGVGAVLVSFAPHFLFVFHILSMNSAEVTLWALCAWLLLVALGCDRAWPWIGFGVAAGIGLLTKHSMGVFGVGVLAGLLLTRHRRVLRSPWPWIAGAIAALLLAPHLVWQAAHDWPTREFVENAQRYKIAKQSPASFLAEVVLMMGPVTAPVWLVGWWSLLRGYFGPHGRVLGWAAAVVVGVFVFQQSKPYYVTPMWPVLLASGAVVLERATASRKGLRLASVTLLIAGAGALAPFTLPLLPVEKYVAYSRALGVTPNSQERQTLGTLPQHYADMHGWEELARTVSAVYRQLPDHEKASARVLARNYGEAGALEYFADRYALPRVISPHNNYWYWGPGPDGGTLIIIGGTREDHEDAFERLEEAGRTECSYCMPYENGNPIWIGRGWKVPPNQIWREERRFI